MSLHYNHRPEKKNYLHNSLIYGTRSKNYKYNSLVYGAGLRQTIQTIKALFVGQDQLPPPERRLLEQIGTIKITGITIHREPIKTVPVDKIMNIITLGGYNKLMKKYSYDNLLHLYMIVKLENGDNIIVEKNERINIEKSSKNGGEKKNVSVNIDLNLNSILNETKKMMNKDFFTYHPTTNNCQRFITGILKSNGLLTPDLDNFINQKVHELFNEIDSSGKLRKLIASVTKIGTVKDIIMQGGGNDYQEGEGLPGMSAILFAAKAGKDFGSFVNDARNAVQGRKGRRGFDKSPQFNWKK